MQDKFTFYWSYKFIFYKTVFCTELLSQPRLILLQYRSIHQFSYCTRQVKILLINTFLFVYVALNNILLWIKVFIHLCWYCFADIIWIYLSKCFLDRCELSFIGKGSYKHTVVVSVSREFWSSAKTELVSISHLAKLHLCRTASDQFPWGWETPSISAYVISTGSKAERMHHQTSVKC